MRVEGALTQRDDDDEGERPEAVEEVEGVEPRPLPQPSPISHRPRKSSPPPPTDPLNSPLGRLVCPHLHPRRGIKTVSRCPKKKPPSRAETFQHEAVQIQEEGNA